MHNKTIHAQNLCHLSYNFYLHLQGQENETFIGVAMNGNPIYDNKPIDFVLDECNGAFVMRDDGLMQYRYYATNTYPFTVGCFRDPPVINGGDECDGEELLEKICFLLKKL